MNTTLRLLAGTFLLAITMMTELHAQTPDPLASLVAAERAFARMAADAGMKPAFLSWLDDQGIVFRPDAKNGKAVWSEAPESRAILAWDPVWAEVSSDGSLGYTTGPWTFRPSPEEPVASSGTFISVWRRDRNGRWKVMVDLGVSHQLVSDTTDSVATSTIRPVVPPNAQSAEIERERIHALEVDLSAQATVFGFSRAIQPFVADDTRFNRNGQTPIVGRSAIDGLLAQDQAQRSWLVSGWDIAGSRDLAYAWGTYQTVALEPGAAEKGSYLRIWRRNPAGKWTVALEVTSPLP